MRTTIVHGLGLVVVLFVHESLHAEPRPIAEFQADDSSVSWIGLSRDNKRLAIRYAPGDYTGRIRIWNIDDRKSKDIEFDVNVRDARLPITSRGVFEDSCLVFGQGREVRSISVSEKREIVQAFKLAGEPRDHSHLDIDRSSDGKSLWLLSIVDEKQLILRSVTNSTNVSREKAVEVVAINTDRITATGISGDGKLVALGVARNEAGRNHYSVEFWDTGEKKRIHVREAHDGSVNTIAMGDSPSFVASGGFDGKLIVWDGRTGKLVCSRTHKYPLTSICLLRETGFLVYVTSDREKVDNAFVIDLRSGKTTESACLSEFGVRCLTVSADLKQIAALGGNRLVRVWKTETVFPKLWEELKERK